MQVAIRWADSADRHGIDHQDAMHAIGNAVYREDDFDEPRPPADIRPTLFIGPPRPPGGRLLEVMVEIGRHDVTVFHVIEARPKHLERMEDQ
jgi:hypothetical protein